MHLKSNESTDTETVMSQCEFKKLTSESVAELIHACYDDNPEYCMEEIKKIKEKNISIPEKGDKSDDFTQLAN